jgi:hypothetical protein
MTRQDEKSAKSEQTSHGGPSSDIDPKTGREKPRMRLEDMPSHTPQGRTVSEPPDSADEQGRQGNMSPTGQGRMKPET